MEPNQQLRLNVANAIGLEVLTKLELELQLSLAHSQIEELQRKLTEKEAESNG